MSWALRLRSAAMILICALMAPMAPAQSDLAKEAALADLLGLRQRQKDYNGVQETLARELAAVRASQRPDRVREALILQELADLRVRKSFDHDAANRHLTELEALLRAPDFPARYAEVSAYRDIPPVVNNRAVRYHSDYVLVYRRLTLPELQSAAASLRDELSRVVSQGNASTRTTSSANSAESAARAQELRSFVSELEAALKSASGRTEVGQILARLSLFYYRLDDPTNGDRQFAALMRHTGQNLQQPRLGDWNPLLPPRLQVELLHLRAHSALRAGTPADALALWEWAIATYESFRSTIGAEDKRVDVFANLGALYGRALEAALDANRPRAAALLAERGKSRALADALQGQTELLRADDRKTLGGFESDQARAVASSGQRNLSPVRALSGDNVQLLTFSGSYLPSEDVLQDLVTRQPGSGVVMYFEAGRSLGAVVITARGVSAVRLRHDRETVEREARKLFRVTPGGVEFVLNNPALRLLNDALILPVEPLLKDVNQLVFMPFGMLQNVPFNALYDGQRYAIQKWEISSTPSLSVLASLMKPKPRAAGTALFVGNPDYRKKAPQLEFAEIEAKTLAKSVPGNTLLIGAQATESAVRRLAGQHAIVHLATHGKFVDSAPLKSFVLLTDDAQNDGQLSAEEIFRLDLRMTQLVILSACESSVAKIRHGDETYGFFRAFAYAGAPALIASQWVVDDEATSDLMVELYQRLLQGASFSSALRAAQLMLIQKGSPVDHWAPFQLTGNGFLTLQR